MGRSFLSLLLPCSDPALGAGLPQGERHRETKREGVSQTFEKLEHTKYSIAFLSSILYIEIAQNSKTLKKQSEKIYSLLFQRTETFLTMLCKVTLMGSRQVMVSYLTTPEQWNDWAWPSFQTVFVFSSSHQSDVTIPIKYCFVNILFPRSKTHFYALSSQIFPSAVQLFLFKEMAHMYDIWPKKSGLVVPNKKTQFWIKR